MASQSGTARMKLVLRGNTSGAVGKAIGVARAVLRQMDALYDGWSYVQFTERRLEFPWGELLIKWKRSRQHEVVFTGTGGVLPATATHTLRYFTGKYAAYHKGFGWSSSPARRWNGFELEPAVGGLLAAFDLLVAGGELYTTTGGKVYQWDSINEQWVSVYTPPVGGAVYALHSGGTPGIALTSSEFLIVGAVHSSGNTVYQSFRFDYSELREPGPVWWNVEHDNYTFNTSQTEEAYIDATVYLEQDSQVERRVHRWETPDEIETTVGAAWKSRFYFAAREVFADGTYYNPNKSTVWEGIVSTIGTAGSGFTKELATTPAPIYCRAKDGWLVVGGSFTVVNGVSGSFGAFIWAPDCDRQTASVDVGVAGDTYTLTIGTKSTTVSGVIGASAIASLLARQANAMQTSVLAYNAGSGVLRLVSHVEGASFTATLTVQGGNGGAVTNFSFDSDPIYFLTSGNFSSTALSTPNRDTHLHTQDLPPSLADVATAPVLVSGTLVHNVVNTGGVASTWHLANNITASNDVWECVFLTVDTLTPANNTFSVTISGATESVAGNTSATQTRDDLLAALQASSDPAFSSITWASATVAFQPAIRGTKSGGSFEPYLSMTGDGQATVTPFYKTDSYVRTRPTAAVINTNGRIEWSGVTLEGSTPRMVYVYGANDGGWDTGILSVPVVTEAPVVAAVGNFSKTIAGSSYAYVKQLTLTAGQVLATTWEIVTGPSGLTVNSNGIVSGSLAIGNYDVAVRATNLAGSFLASWMIDIQAATGTAPSITPLGPQSFDSSLGSYVQTLTFTGSGPMTWSIVSGPSGFAVAGNEIAAALVWTFPTVGVHNITYKATNPYGEDTDTFTLTVT